MPNQPASERAVLTCEFIHRSQLFGLWGDGRTGNVRSNRIVLNIYGIDIAGKKKGDPRAACLVCADPTHYRSGAPDVFVVLSRQGTEEFVAIASVCRQCVRTHAGEALLPAVAAGFEKSGRFTAPDACCAPVERI